MMIDKLHRNIDFQIQRRFSDDMLKTDCSICEWNTRNDTSKDRSFYFQLFFEIAQRSFQALESQDYIFQFFIYRKFYSHSPSKKIDDYHMRKDKIFHFLIEHGIQPDHSVTADEVLVGDPQTYNYGYGSLLPLENEWLDKLYPLNAVIKIFACPRKKLPLLKKKISFLTSELIFSDDYSWETIQWGPHDFRTALLEQDAMIFSSNYCITDWPELSLLGIAKSHLTDQISRSGLFVS